jgi:hypothetical protein
MAQHQITVTRSAAVPVGEPVPPGTPGVNGNFTLSIGTSYLASGSVNVDPSNAIFKLNRRPADPNNPAGPPASDYQGVCTPFDLKALPVNSPLPGTSQYRAAQVDRRFANQYDADLEWGVVKGDAQALCDNLTAADNLSTQDTFTTA